MVLALKGLFHMFHFMFVYGEGVKGIQKSLRSDPESLAKKMVDDSK